MTTLGPDVIVIGMSDHDERQTAPFPMERWQAADLITPMCIRVAATLGLADHIVNGADTAAALAEATATDPDALGRLLEHLVTAGIVYRLVDGGVLADRPWRTAP